jgi:hypothetical protein
MRLASGSASRRRIFRVRKCDHDGNRRTVIDCGCRPARISDIPGHADPRTQWRGAHPRTHWRERVHAAHDGRRRRFLEARPGFDDLHSDLPYFRTGPLRGLRAEARSYRQRRLHDERERSAADPAADHQLRIEQQLGRFQSSFAGNVRKGRLSGDIDLRPDTGRSFPSASRSSDSRSRSSDSRRERPAVTSLACRADG